MKPSILFILHMPPPIHGAAMMGQYIHDSNAINGAFSCHYINMSTAQSLEDIGHGGWHKFVLILKKWALIVKTIRSIHPDLVYLTPNSWGKAFYRDFITVQIVKCLCQNLLLHFHNMGVAQFQNRRIDNWLYRRFFAGTKVLLLSSSLYADVQCYVKKGQLMVCPNGIPLHIGVNWSKPLSLGKPRILMIANLLKTKGVIELLDACKKMRDNGLDFCCEIVGGETADYDASSFQKEIEIRGISKIVQYCGRRYGAGKTACLLHATIFCLPSYTEAFPLVTLEAMEYALPIVATAVGGVVDQVKDGVNGYLIPCKSQVTSTAHSPINVDSLVTALSRLVNAPDLCRKMGENSRKIFLEQYTLDKFEHRFIECMEAAISK